MSELPIRSLYKGDLDPSPRRPSGSAFAAVVDSECGESETSTSTTTPAVKIRPTPPPFGRRTRSDLGDLRRYSKWWHPIRSSLRRSTASDPDQLCLSRNGSSPLGRGGQIGLSVIELGRWSGGCSRACLADQVRELLQVARRRRFSRNEVVFHRDDPGDSLHLISKGRFAIQVMTPLGETATIAIRGPGESFGEMALVGGARRSATVLALEDGETFSIYQPRVRAHPSTAPRRGRRADAVPRQRGADAERAAARGALRPGRAARPAPAGRAGRALSRSRRSRR